jgi:hypothetical protein
MDESLNPDENKDLGARLSRFRHPDEKKGVLGAFPGRRLKMF